METRGRAMTTRLLLADSDPTARALTELTLRDDAQYRLSIAASGSEAIALAHGIQPGVAILGARLKDATGFEICRELRANVGTADVSPDPPNPRPDSAAGTRKQVPL